MEWLKRINRKMLLGQLLINENLISQAQLTRAIEQQMKTGQRLGDVMAELDLVSKHQVAKVLSKQRKLRFMASIVTALLGPVPAYTAAVAAPVAPITTHHVASAVQKQGAARSLTEQKRAQSTSQGSRTYMATQGMEVIEGASYSDFGPWASTFTGTDSPFAATKFTPVTLAGQSPVQPSEASPETLFTDESMDTALLTVEQHHSRVANAIRNMWGYQECCQYISKLLMNGDDAKGHARAGFHQDAVAAMMVLIDIHEQRFPALPAGNGAAFAKSAQFNAQGHLA